VRNLFAPSNRWAPFSAPSAADLAIADGGAAAGAAGIPCVGAGAPALDEAVEFACSSAIAEVGAAEACLIAIENPYADIAPSSIDRIVERFGHLGAIREALLARTDLSLAARQALVRQLSSKLADFVAGRA